VTEQAGGVTLRFGAGEVRLPGIAAADPIDAETLPG
jgi:hypothetical protein